MMHETIKKLASLKLMNAENNNVQMVKLETIDNPPSLDIFSA